MRVWIGVYRRQPPLFVQLAPSSSIHTLLGEWGILSSYYQSVLNRLPPLCLAIIFLYVANSLADPNYVTTIVSVMFTSCYCGMYRGKATRPELVGRVHG